MSRRDQKPDTQYVDTSGIHGHPWAKFTKADIRESLKPTKYFEKAKFDAAKRSKGKP